MGESDHSISDAELVPYVTYLNKLLKKERNYSIDVNLFAELVFSLVKEGYINTEEEAPPLYYHFLNKLCDSWDQVSVENYTKVLWTMALTEQSNLHNPLIPVMFEKMPKIKFDGKD